MEEIFVADTKHHCELCRVAGVYFSFQELPMTEKEIHKLFHEACSDCDYPSFGSLVNLCGFCHHLRPRHLMRCWPEKFPERFILDHGQKSIVVPFQPGRQDSEQCEFCQFLILLGEKCEIGVRYGISSPRVREPKLIGSGCGTG
jgi:hypothetical protein